MTRLPTTSSTRDRNACCICCRASAGDSGEPSARCVAAAGGCFIHDRQFIRSSIRKHSSMTYEGDAEERGEEADGRRQREGRALAVEQPELRPHQHQEGQFFIVPTHIHTEQRTLLRGRRRRSWSASGRWPRGRDGMPESSALTVLRERARTSARSARDAEQRKAATGGRRTEGRRPQHRVRRPG
jgi:hypothetical protein